MDQSFYHVLCKNDEFSIALGKLVLSSSKLESCLKTFIEAHGKVWVLDKTPLGGLIDKLLKNYPIDRAASEQLQFVLHERNYFVHKLHTSLSMYPTDQFELESFINRANGLASEMEWFSDLLTSILVSRKSSRS